MSFIYTLSVLGSAYQSVTGNTSTTVTCESEVENGAFYNFMMIPSIVEILLMAIFVRRKAKCLSCCRGRPGLVTPVDLFEVQHRTSYMATYGSIAFLCSEVIFHSKYVIDYDGPLAFRIFVIMLSVVVYGLAFFPIFAALSMRTILSYGLGSLHVWTFAVVTYYDTFHCAYSWGTKITMLLVARNLPKLFSLTYLSIMMPLRFVKAVRSAISKSSNVENCKVFSEDDEIRKIRESRLGRHIQKNFVLPKPSKPIVREGLKGKLLNIILPIWNVWIYRWNPEFKYSGRFLSTITITFIIIYKLTCEMLIFLLNIIDLGMNYFDNVLDDIGWTDNPGDTDEDKNARATAKAFIDVLYAFKVCVIVTTTVELLLTSLLLLHIVSSYRKFLLSLHKGVSLHIPVKEEISNASLMVGSIRYGGYQVGYTAWAYLLQWILLLLLSIVIAVIVTAPTIIQFILDQVVQLWPVPVTTIILSIAQILISKFFFLQRRGEILAIENRRSFFIFSYFMFFYNIFIGVVSCLLRIIKAIVIGALFLGRLDHSTLPRRFQLMDPGFDAYVGFLHLENAHRHPVMLAFLAILQVYVSANNYVHNVTTDKEELDKIKTGTMKPEVNRRRIQQRWHMAYTLYFNPQLRMLRKHAIDAQEDKLTAHEKARMESKDKNCHNVKMEDNGDCMTPL